jgi:hypothetical protein
MPAYSTDQAYGLRPPGDPAGVSCDERGPAWGPLPLLRRRRDGRLAPPPPRELAEDLEYVLDDSGLGHRLALSIAGGLAAAARALNAGDLPTAMAATLRLRLPALAPDQAERARLLIGEVPMLKASPTDPNHPGWPAGTPGGKGGRFRPKEGSGGEDGTDQSTTVRTEVENRLERLVKRRMIRGTARILLRRNRVMRFIAEALSNAVPGLDVVGDIALAADTAKAMIEFKSLATDGKVALDFAKGGPRSLGALQVSRSNQTFDSFDAFKKIDLEKQFGAAGDGWEYHHIVEQVSGGHLSPRDINSTRNIVRIPKMLHEEINAEFEQLSRKSGWTMTNRAYLKGKPFEEQWQEGVRIMKKVGVIG